MPDAASQRHPPGTLTLNFEGGADDIPTYSLADLRACAEKGDSEFFKREFDGKIVHHRHLAQSRRPQTDLEALCHRPRGRRARHAAPCRRRQREGQFKRTTIAGVYVHATAVNNLLRGDTVRELDRWQAALIAVAFALLAAIAAALLAPACAAFAYPWLRRRLYACRNGAVHTTPSPCR